MKQRTKLNMTNPFKKSNKHSYSQHSTPIYQSHPGSNLHAPHNTTSATTSCSSPGYNRKPKYHLCASPRPETMRAKWTARPSQKPLHWTQPTTTQRQNHNSTVLSKCEWDQCEHSWTLEWNVSTPQRHGSRCGPVCGTQIRHNPTTSAGKVVRRCPASIWTGIICYKCHINSNWISHNV